MKAKKSDRRLSQNNNIEIMMVSWTVVVVVEVVRGRGIQDIFGDRLRGEISIRRLKVKQ
jgi:hypothetical protein